MNPTMHREAPVTFGLKQEQERANFIFGRGFDIDFFTENFQRKKKKKNIVGIRTHAHSFDGPVQLPLGYQITHVELRLYHTFNKQLNLVYPVSHP